MRLGCSLLSHGCNCADVIDDVAAVAAAATAAAHIMAVAAMADVADAGDPAAAADAPSPRSPELMSGMVPAVLLTLCVVVLMEQTEFGPQAGATRKMAWAQ